MNELLKQATDRFAEMQSDRRTIHRFGGYSFDLRQSADYILSRLSEMGIEGREISNCGIVATIGQGDKCLLFRADFDALLLPEETGLEFANQTGTCHACGHDFHASMLLGAAKLLKERENSLPGVVKLMFQPSEETLEGAIQMVEAGVLENPTVNAALALHVNSGAAESKTGTVVYSRGATYAAGDKVRITVRGRGGHGAQPSKNIDPVTAGAHIIVALQQIISMEVPSTESATLTFGIIQGGTADNIMPDEIFFKGTLRTFSAELRPFIKERIEQVATQVGAALRCSVTVDFSGPSVDPVINDAKLAQALFPYIEEVTGQGATTIVDTPSSFGSEDFSHITSRVPGVMINLGAGDRASGYDKAMHNPAIVLDENCLPYGAAVLANCAVRWLEDNK